MAPAGEALERFLHAHEPYPAPVIDERWNLMLANDALLRLMTGIAPELLEPPANTLRIALHPDGMAPYTVNFAEWSAEILHRIQLRATFVTATDITLAGLAIEAFYPATQQTADILLDLSRAESSAADRYPERVAVHQGYGSLS
jgi:hypothetical protein